MPRKKPGRRSTTDRELIVVNRTAQNDQAMQRFKQLCADPTATPRDIINAYVVVLHQMLSDRAAAEYTLQGRGILLLDLENVNVRQLSTTPVRLIYVSAAQIQEKQIPIPTSVRAQLDEYEPEQEFVVTIVHPSARYGLCLKRADTLEIPYAPPVA